MTSDDKPTLNIGDEEGDDDKVESSNEDSLAAESSAVVEKPSHKTGRGITLK